MLKEQNVCWEEYLPHAQFIVGSNLSIRHSPREGLQKGMTKYQTHPRPGIPAQKILSYTI